MTEDGDFIQGKCGHRRYLHHYRKPL